MKVKKLSVVCILVCIATGAMGCGLSIGKTKVPALMEPAAIKYNTYEVKSGNICKYIFCEGVLVPSKVEKVKFNKISGGIKSFSAKAGDMVKKDQLLVELVSDDISNEITLQDFNIKKAEIRYERMKKMNATVEDLKESEIELSNANFEMKSLREQLASTKLTAPISGKIINKIDKNVGEEIGENDVVFVIADSNSMEIECIDKKASDFKAGNIVSCIHNGRRFEGKVEKIDVKDGSPSMIVKIDNFPSGAQLGDSVKVTFEISRKDNVILVPKRFVKSSGKYSVVHVLENNKKVDRFVEVGIENEMDIEIVSGLKVGDKLID